MKAELCPDCGSAKVEMQALGVIAGDSHSRAKASCDNCGWAGEVKDMLQAQVPEQQGLTQDDAHAIALQVASTYQALLAQLAAQPIGLAMIESGMVGKNDTKSLTRMIRAATLGAHKATLEEVEKIQKESQGDRSGN